ADREARARAPVGEQRVGQARLVGALEVARGDDLVGVDVDVEQHDGARRQRAEARRGHGDVLSPAGRRSAGRSGTSVRGSATWPVTAAAAAVHGDASSVRPPWPWRPSKLRFDVETASWPGDSWSPFIAMHIEQPGSRHSAPARSNASPCGTAARPARYANVVSSGAIMPARAPASIDMLQTVMRPSMSSARIASPAYSMTWPVAPPMPIRAIIARIRSL